MEDDFIIGAMRAYGWPLTRETYLALAYLGEPVELSAEELAAIPSLPSEADLISGHALGIEINDDTDSWADTEDE